MNQEQIHQQKISQKLKDKDHGNQEQPYYPNSQQQINSYHINQAKNQKVMIIEPLQESKTASVEKNNTNKFNFQPENSQDSSSSKLMNPESLIRSKNQKKKTLNVTENDKQQQQILFEMLKKQIGSRTAQEIKFIQNKIFHFPYIQKVSKKKKGADQQIAQVMEFEFCPKGKALFHADDRPEYFYFLFAGKATVLIKKTDEQLMIERQQQIQNHQHQTKYSTYVNYVSKQIQKQKLQNVREKLKNQKIKGQKQPQIDIKVIQYFQNYQSQNDQEQQQSFGKEQELFICFFEQQYQQNKKVEIPKEIDFKMCNELDLPISQIFEPYRFFKDGQFSFTFIKNMEQWEVFGDYGLLLGQTRTATILASEDLYLGKISKINYQKIIKELEQFKIQKKIIFFQNCLGNTLNLDQCNLLLLHFYNKKLFQAGQTIFEEESRQKELYLIKSGEVSLSKKLMQMNSTEKEAKKQVVVNSQEHMKLKIKKKPQQMNFCIIGAGEFIDIQFLIYEKHERSYTAKAIFDTKVLFISIHTLQKLFNDMPEFKNIMISIAKNKKRWHDDKLMQLQQSQVNIRQSLLLQQQQNWIQKESEEVPVGVAGGVPNNNSNSSNTMRYPNMPTMPIMDEESLQSPVVSPKATQKICYSSRQINVLLPPYNPIQTEMQEVTKPRNNSDLPSLQLMKMCLSQGNLPTFAIENEQNSFISRNGIPSPKSLIINNVSGGIDPNQQFNIFSKSQQINACTQTDNPTYNAFNQISQQEQTKTTPFIKQYESIVQKQEEKVGRLKAILSKDNYNYIDWNIKTQLEYFQERKTYEQNKKFLNKLKESNNLYSAKLQKIKANFTKNKSRKTLSNLVPLLSPKYFNATSSVKFMSPKVSSNNILQTVENKCPQITQQHQTINNNRSTTSIFADNNEIGEPDFSRGKLEKKGFCHQPYHSPIKLTNYPIFYFPKRRKKKNLSLQSQNIVTRISLPEKTRLKTQIINNSPSKNELYK